MSLVFTLASAAIMTGISISSATAIAVLAEASEGNRKLDEPIPTMFQDCDLLVKTLNAFGCGINVVNENEIRVETECGDLHYVRSNNSQPFGLVLGDIRNPDQLFEYLRTFEVDYGRNVQAYTYDHIRKNLTEDMEIVNEEVLEDNSLIITINIE